MRFETIIYGIYKELRFYSSVCSKYGVLFCLTAVCFFYSCDKPTILLNQPNEDVRSLGGFISNNYNYTLLAAAMEYTGLLDTLNKPGDYTLLAADNAAFKELGLHSTADIKRLDRDSLRRVLAHHILPYVLREDDVPVDVPDLRYITLSGDSLYVSRVTSTLTWDKMVKRGGMNSFASNSGITFSGIDGIDMDKNFSNGVLHTVSKLVNLFSEMTIQEWLERDPNYSVFVAGLKKFNLWDVLSKKGPFTVFAPRNLYLENAGITQNFVDTLRTENFIGSRLFGSYIMYDKFYFVLDYDFYLHRDQQYWFFTPLKDDPGTYQIFFGSSAKRPESISDISNDVLRTEYGLGISRSPMPNSDGTAYLGAYSYMRDGKSRPFSLGLSKTLNDNVCRNGLIHDLQGVLVIPDKARTSNNF